MEWCWHEVWYYTGATVKDNRLLPNFKELLESPCEIQLVCRLRPAGHSP